MAKGLDEYSREELIDEIKKLKKQKRFGLVWEDKPEKVVKECEEKLPVLKEVQEKAIGEVEGEPTNIIIEGDNYHALSILNYTHAGKIDVIYIDPPYNTGNKDFIYNDCYVDKEDTFRHSKWLSFMEKRLRLAKNLLADDGVIFISIDENEQPTLRLLCDEIFGNSGFVNNLVWYYKNSTMKSSTDKLAKTHENILVYRGKNFKPFPLRDGEISRDLLNRFGKYANEKNEILYKNVKHEESYLSRILPKFKKEFGRMPEDNDVLQRLEPNFVRDVIERPTIRSNNFYEQFGIEFSNPKNPDLIKLLLRLSSNDSGKTINTNAIVLDFFAGSGTTGQAVMELNKEDGGHRQFILVTNNEANGKTDAGEEGIAEKVTYPRIKTVITGIRPDGSKYSDGLPANLRYFKTDFVEKGKTTDDTREALITECCDMIRIRENAFEHVANSSEYRFYKNDKVFVPIIFDQFAIAETWEKVEELNTEKLPVHCYNFSYNRHANEEEIPEDTDLEWTACSIPESVLEVYKRIFRKKEA